MNSAGKERWGGGVVEKPSRYKSDLKERQNLTLRMHVGRGGEGVSCSLIFTESTHLSHALGRRIVAGCDDGGMRLYDPSAYTPRAVEEIHDAHGAAVDTTSVTFSADGNCVLSRTMDDCLRLWDVRRFDSPLVTFDDLPNNSAQTGAVFNGSGGNSEMLV